MCKFNMVEYNQNIYHQLHMFWEDIVNNIDCCICKHLNNSNRKFHLYISHRNLDIERMFYLLDSKKMLKDM